MPQGATPGRNLGLSATQRRELHHLMRPSAQLATARAAGRFWTERELGALLNKPTLIPVLHGVTFEDVAEYSGILPDLAGFTTSRDTVADIAEKIAAAVLVEGAA
ncbi:MAG: hypothetical protein ACRDSZ_14565 [Pseudonocardiaceae bacterium]